MGVASGRRTRIAIDTRPLRIPAYRRLWVSTAITAVGSQLTTVAVPKQIYDLTGSSGFVGLAGAFGLVPLLIFGLWGGALADAFDRRTVILVTNVGVAAASVAFWVLALTSANVWVVLSLLAVQQAFVAINLPTRTAAVARLVPTELIAAATALSSTVGSVGMVFGPMLAGALMPIAGLPVLYLIDAIALVIATVLVTGLPAMAPLDGNKRRAGLKDIADGFRYVAAKNVLLASFLLDIIAMVAGMPRALFPEMAERTFGDTLGDGKLALGWLYAAIPIGALLFGLFSGWLSHISRHGVGVTAAVLVWGLAVVGFGLSGHLWLAVAFLIIAGAADMVSMVYRSAILQTAVTDEMRGRMQGVFTVVVAGGPRIADLAHGWAAAGTGTGAAATGGGVLVVVLTVIAVICLPAFWRYRATTG